MCGIAGIVGPLGRDGAGVAIKAMTSAQVHRGPDDEGVEILGTPEGAVALGSRRLAIIDLSPAGHQPMRDEQTGNVLAYNGETYNFPKLRAELEAKGHTFRGHSDTEVLLVGYREWGRGLLDRLRGMFAFALWDAGRERLLVARDHLGIKPLYYSTSTRAGFLCASELRALMAGGLVDATLDRRALATFLAYGAVQEPLTIYQGVRALPAGSWLEVDRRGVVVEQGRYWDFPEPHETTSGEEELIAEGRDLLERSVKRHLLSDVPLGVFLSSGIDSTSVAGLASRTSEQDVHAFTVSFPEVAELNEQPYARASADRLGLVFHDIPVDSSTALSWAVQGLNSMDQPSMDGLNTYIVSRAVREAGLTVALSGQGGDEIFGGYHSFARVPPFLRLLRATRLAPDRVKGPIAAVLGRAWGRTGSEKARDIALLPPEVEPLYFKFRRLLPDRDMARLGFDARELDLTPTFLDPAATPASLPENDVVAAVSRLESRFYLGNTLLRDGDVFGMANSLEIRVPFLDRDVVDWAYRLPGEVLLPRRSAPKHLLRRMCADLLGSDQLERPKQGFNLPLATWMKGALADLRAEGLAAVVDSGLVTPDGVGAIERSYLDDDYRSAWTRIWALVALGHWIETNRSLTAVGQRA